MLTELHIRQFALVEEIRLELTAGMTVFTGETGAGKSILVDALGAIFGNRASADWVRHGAKKAELSACLELANPHLNNLLEQQGIEIESCLILRRVINNDGRSRGWVNGVAVPLKTLQAIGMLCLDLHGQHEHQQLMQAIQQRRLVDTQIDRQLQQQLAEAWHHWKQANETFTAWQQQIQHDRQQEQWLRQQLEELEQLQLCQGLLDQLEQAVNAGTHLEQLRDGAALALHHLDEGEPSVRSLLAEALHGIAQISQFHPSLQQAAGGMQQADDLLGELPALLREVTDLELDASELADKEQQLNALQSLLHRHACDEQGLLTLQEQWQEQLNALDTAQWDGERLEENCQQTALAYRQLAEQLHQARTKQAKKLALALRPALDRLALTGMQLRIDVNAQDSVDNWRVDGWDQVQFMLSSNPGEPFRALHQVASGGELSRLVLALKACGMEVNPTAIAVFDEVDVGIGGETAWSVGELLHSMGQERQLLVISHLPQVAVLADQHIGISKDSDGQRTHSSLTTLDQTQRLKELARMLGDSSAQGMKQARALWKRRKVS